MDYSNIRQEKYIVQGYTVIDDEIVISAYNPGDPSKLYFYDKNKEKFKRSVTLNSKAHVGGVTYDDKNKIIFVTGSLGRVMSFNKKDLKPIKNNISLEGITNINMATIYYHNKKLYAATFGIRGKLFEIEYEYNKEEITLKSIKQIFKTGLATQGIAFYKNYLVVSSSYGKGVKSKLSIYDKDKNYKLVNKRTVVQSGLEGIYMDKEGFLTGIFEFGKQQVKNFGHIEALKINTQRYSPINNTKMFLGTAAFEYNRNKKNKQKKK